MENKTLWKLSDGKDPVFIFGEDFRGLQVGSIPEYPSTMRWHIVTPHGRYGIDEGSAKKVIEFLGKEYPEILDLTGENDA